MLVTDVSKYVKFCNNRCAEFSGKAAIEKVTTSSSSALIAECKVKHLAFCSDFLRMLRNTNWIDDALLFTDEVTFLYMEK
jgi:hypothetical protein